MGARKPLDERAPMSGASQKKVLLAGPVGRRRKSTRTYPGFPEAATYLRNLFAQVLDPSDSMLSATMHTPYRDHVERSMEMFNEADGIVTLPGWEGSILGQVLVALAHGCRLPIYHLDEHGGITASEWGRPDHDLDWLVRQPGRKRIL